MIFRDRHMNFQNEYAIEKLNSWWRTMYTQQLRSYLQCYVIDYLLELGLLDDLTSSAY